jgi:hypothetical protein
MVAFSRLASRRRRSKSVVFAAYHLRGVALACLLATANCAQIPPTSSVAIPLIPDGAARLWFYRDYEPYETSARPYVRLNDQVTGVSEPNGAFYRDVAPAHYSITVDSAGRDVNQFADVDLAAGQETYAKILSLRSWLAEDCMTWGGCDTFYVRLMPAKAARADISHRPFYGGG